MASPKAAAVHARAGIIGLILKTATRAQGHRGTYTGHFRGPQKQLLGAGGAPTVHLPAHVLRFQGIFQGRGGDNRCRRP